MSTAHLPPSTRLVDALIPDQHSCSVPQQTELAGIRFITASMQSTAPARGTCPQQHLDNCTLIWRIAQNASPPVGHQAQPAVEAATDVLRGKRHRSGRTPVTTTCRPSAWSPQAPCPAAAAAASCASLW